MGYDKKYNTRIIRATFLMFNTMLNSKIMDYELFYDYTGLSIPSYILVRKIIQEMIIDLNIKCLYKTINFIQDTKKTRYIAHKFIIDTSNPINYSYVFSNNLDYEKKINYSMTITYLMLKNNEEVNYKKLSIIFPLFTKKRFYNLINYLKY